MHRYIFPRPHGDTETHAQTQMHTHVLCFCLQSGGRRSTRLEIKRPGSHPASLPVNSRMLPPYPGLQFPRLEKLSLGPDGSTHPSCFRAVLGSSSPSPTFPPRTSLSLTPLFQNPGPFPGLSTALGPPCTSPHPSGSPGLSSLRKATLLYTSSSTHKSLGLSLTKATSSNRSFMPYVSNGISESKNAGNYINTTQIPSPPPPPTPEKEKKQKQKQTTWWRSTLAGIDFTLHSLLLSWQSRGMMGKGHDGAWQAGARLQGSASA